MSNCEATFIGSLYEFCSYFVNTGANPPTKIILDKRAFDSICHSIKVVSRYGDTNISNKGIDSFTVRFINYEIKIESDQNENNQTTG